VEQPVGTVDVFVGSIPIVLNGESRGLEVRRKTIDGELKIDVVLKEDGSPLNTDTGCIGALVRAREQDVSFAIDTLDDFANKLIFQVNRLHSQGQGERGYTSLTSTSAVADSTLALNHADTELPFTPKHGSFQLHVTQVSSGQRSTSAREDGQTRVEPTFHNHEPPQVASSPDPRVPLWQSEVPDEVG